MPIGILRNMGSNTGWLFWMVFLSLMHILAFPYQQIASICDEKCQRAAEPLPEEPIENRLERLEVEMNKLTKLLKEATQTQEESPTAADRINSLETELAETKKVLQDLISFFVRFWFIVVPISLFCCLECPSKLNVLWWYLLDLILQTLRSVLLKQEELSNLLEQMKAYKWVVRFPLYLQNSYLPVVVA